MDVRYGTGAERIAAEAARRRTFAIISHPDAGKTTLTEQLLLLGGGIRLAGQVDGPGEARRARPDWVEIQQERGTPVPTAGIPLGIAGWGVDLFGTPGGQG